MASWVGIYLAFGKEPLGAFGKCLMERKGNLWGPPPYPEPVKIPGLGFSPNLLKNLEKGINPRKKIKFKQFEEIGKKEKP